MALPKRSLRPAGGNDRGTLLSTLGLVSRGRMQLARIVETVVAQFVPGPQVFEGIEVRCIRWQNCDLDGSSQTIQILARQATAMRPQAISDNQQRLFQMGLERLEKFDDLFLFDAAFVQSEQTVGARESCDGRDVGPAEMKLDDGHLSFGCPSAHSGRALADAGLVHEDNQSALSPGFFLRASQVRCFKLRTASSLRSIACFSGFCGLQPREPTTVVHQAGLGALAREPPAERQCRLHRATASMCISSAEPRPQPTLPRAAFPSQQHPSSLQSLSGGLAQSLLCHSNSLQYQPWRDNASDSKWLS